MIRLGAISALCVSACLFALSEVPTAHAGVICGLRDLADHACMRSPGGVVRDAIIPGGEGSHSSRSFAHHSRSESGKDESGQYEYAPDPRLRAPKSRMRCLTLEIEYLSRHGLRKPAGLKLFHGCRLWRLDHDYHRSL